MLTGTYYSTIERLENVIMNISGILFIALLLMKVAQIGLVADLSYYIIVAPLAIPLAIDAILFTSKWLCGKIAIIATHIYQYLDKSKK